MPIGFPEEYFPVQVINSPIGLVLDGIETEVFVLYQNFPVRQKFGNIPGSSKSHTPTQG